MIGGEALQQIKQVLESGGIIAYPTEAVWGLGCDPWCEAAVLRLLKLKQRSTDKGLILVAAAFEQLDFLLHDLPLVGLQRMQAGRSEFCTWLVPHKNRVPLWISGAHDTVAVRVSRHDIVQSLCQTCGVLVSTSANLAGQEPARTQRQVEHYFPVGLQFIVAGQVQTNLNPSSIYDAMSGALIRA